MSDKFVRLAAPVAAISEDEYRRDRRNQYAGPISELLLVDTREKYAALGATHWQIHNDRGATVLRPVTVD